MRPSPISVAAPSAEPPPAAGPRRSASGPSEPRRSASGPGAAESAPSGAEWGGLTAILHGQVPPSPLAMKMKADRERALDPPPATPGKPAGPPAGAGGPVESYANLLLQVSTQPQRMARPRLVRRARELAAREARAAEQRHPCFPEWLLDRSDFQESCSTHAALPVVAAARTLPADRSEAQVGYLAAWLKANWRRAKTMSIDRLSSVAETLEYDAYAAGDTIMSLGDLNRTYYIVFSGLVSATADGEESASALFPGQQFGDSYMASDEEGVDDMLSGVSVVADKDTEVLHIDRRALRNILLGYQEAEDVELVNYLRQLPLLKAWSRGRLRSLARVASHRSYSKGDIIVRQGTPPDFVYFILEGAAGVYKEVLVREANRWPVSTTQHEMKVRFKRTNFAIALLTPGDYFGEKGVTDNTPRAATVVAQTPIELLTIDKSAFASLIESRNKAAHTANIRTKEYKDALEVFTTEHARKQGGGRGGGRRGGGGRGGGRGAGRTTALPPVAARPKR